MKSDMDRLMAARGLQAIIVTGGEEENTPRRYLTNGAAIGTGTVVKKPGEAPILIANAMEIEEAAKSGLKVYTPEDFGWSELVAQAGGERTKADTAMWGRYFERFNIPAGKIGVYGVGQINVYLEIIRLLEKAYPQYQFVGEQGMSLFDEAYTTKDADEIARIKSVAARTTVVLQATWDFIASHQAQGDAVVKADGQPLTIGDVKRFVLRALLDQGLEDTGMIFAQGRDAGFPHSRGEADTPLRQGQPIVFDLFPRELGGGYFHDSTRTWCIGYAPPEIQEIYGQVMNAFEIAVDTFKVGAPGQALQQAVHSYFESKGHPTEHTHPGTNVGYTHGLGHGLGLNIHERPSLSHTSKDILQVGNVLTIEPGLYYPERGFGVRVEDTLYVDSSGQLVSLNGFPKELVLPLKG